jgi:iron complex transport system ATP-binding protein
MTVALHGAGVHLGGRWIFRNLSFTVMPGRSLAILGPNGRGKTTALHALLGFQSLAEGSRDAPERVGYVPQLLASHAPYALRDVVVMGRCARIGLFGQPRSEDYRAADAAMERVGIADHAMKPFDRLSGGERQMGLLARALATRSNLLVLDEPGSALDLKNQGRLLRLLNELRRSRTMTILFTTHDPNHALFAADEALLLLDQAPPVIGDVGTVLSENQLSRLYDVPMHHLSLPDGFGNAAPVIVPRHHVSGELRP